jgi:hypothetical protein
MQEEEQEWTSARMIFGRLIAVDKEQSKLTIEYKEGNEWTDETFATEGWTDDDYDGLLEVLGSDITLKVIDHEAIDYEK